MGKPEAKQYTDCQQVWISKSSHSLAFFDKDVQESFEKFLYSLYDYFSRIYRKTPVNESLFNLCCRFVACNFIKKDALAPVFSWKLYGIFHNSFWAGNIRVAVPSRTYSTTNNWGSYWLYLQRETNLLKQILTWSLLNCIKYNRKKKGKLHFLLL